MENEIKDLVKQSLLELLDQNTEVRRGKTFIIPKNVEGKYTVLLGLSIGELTKWVFPPLTVVALLYVVPPHSIPFVICKSIISVLLLAVGIAIPAGKPIPFRQNINYAQYAKIMWKYHKRQKLFFIGKRASGLEKAVGYRNVQDSFLHHSR